jgi:hypothetical protein
MKNKFFILILILIIVFISGCSKSSQQIQSTISVFGTGEDNMKTLTIHPILNRSHFYIDHEVGFSTYLGDALGRDFVVVSFRNGFINIFENEGLRNEDWFGWRADVLAPVNGIVKEIYINSVTNTPGIQNPGKASVIIIERDDGVNVALAHIREPQIEVGDHVVQGQIIAKVGNDGWARCPHIHMGAWLDEEPLEIEIDRQLLADVINKVGEIFWVLGTEEEVSTLIK